MPGYINPNSPVGIGNTNDDETSLNLLKNIKVNTPPNKSNTKPGDLRKWFRTYAIAPGLNPNIWTNNVKFSEFRNSEIFGGIFKIGNEKDTTYDTDDNGAIQITPLHGSLGGGGTFTATLTNLSNSPKKSSTGANVLSISGINSGSYYLILTDNISNHSMKIFIKIALGGSGSVIKSVPSDPNSFNTINGGIRIISPTNQSQNSLSDGVTILCKP